MLNKAITLKYYKYVMWFLHNLKGRVYPSNFLVHVYYVFIKDVFTPFILRIEVLNLRSDVTPYVVVGAYT